jgi:BirA family biotin operon repressor/biotin-[acetyl-CoA-carboxylase] ligase
VEFAASIELVRPRLGRLGSTVLYFETIGSTNDEAAKRSAGPEPLAPSPCEGLVVVAEQQTAGRGRRGHTWFSPAGSGLYVSVVLAPGTARTDPARATTLLTLSAGVALAEGIEQATGLRVDLNGPTTCRCRGENWRILAESSGAARRGHGRRRLRDQRG